MIRQTLFTGWNFMRLLRLGLGVFCAIQAIQNHDPLSGFIAAFFLFQAVINTGCCGTNGCAVPIKKKEKDGIEDVEFVEINNNNK